MMKRLLSLVMLILFTSTLLAGCNTARGFGEDIKHLGNSISHAASYHSLIVLKTVVYPSHFRILSIIK